MPIGQLSPHLIPQLAKIGGDTGDVLMPLWTQFREGFDLGIPGHGKSPQNAQSLDIIIMVLGHLTGVAVELFELDVEHRERFEIVRGQVTEHSRREKGGLHRCSFTCSKYFRLTGICCSEIGDSSSIKYHFTPASLAAPSTAARLIWPVPSATSLLTL